MKKQIAFASPEPRRANSWIPYEAGKGKSSTDPAERFLSADGLEYDGFEAFVACLPADTVRNRYVAELRELGTVYGTTGSYVPQRIQREIAEWVRTHDPDNQRLAGAGPASCGDPEGACGAGFEPTQADPLYPAD